MGFGGWEHDANVAMVHDGIVHSIGEEERFTRRRYQGQPHLNSFNFCMNYSGIRLKEIDIVSFFMANDFVAKFEGHYLNSILRRDFKKTICVDHHAAHAASAFFTSSLSESAIITIDGFGDNSSTAVWYGKGTTIIPIFKVRYPHTLGGLWKTITKYLGYSSRDEGKTMALASYGEPRYFDFLMEKIVLHRDGTYRFNIEKYDITNYLSRRSNFFVPIAGQQRSSVENLRQIHFDIAASLQKVTNTIVNHIAESAFKATGSQNLCLAGGVALNSVMNSVLRKESPFAQIYVPPFPGDNGTGLGSALHICHQVYGINCNLSNISPYLGMSLNKKRTGIILDKIGSTLIAKRSAFNPISTSEHINKKQLIINREKVTPKLHHYCSSNVVEDTADFLNNGLVVGWYQGRSEVGPRALGNRSILADPRREFMRDYINNAVKHREWFRPCAPSIIEEACGEYFDSDQCTPFMSFVYQVRDDKKSILPAITHIDGSARVQTVSKTQNPLFYNLLKAFEKRSGIPVLLNTSFNDREPIVNTQEEAICCFIRTNIDILVIGDYIISK